MRAALPSPGPTYGLGFAPGLTDEVGCDGASLPVVLTGWRGAVVEGLVLKWPTATVESATLTCRTVVTSQRPVVMGRNNPSVMMLAETDLELAVELRWRLVTADCVEQRWLARSSWRVVPLEADSAPAEVIANQVVRALAEAVQSRTLWHPSRHECARSPFCSSSPRVPRRFRSWI
jgi:hypothetical protein